VSFRDEGDIRPDGDEQLYDSGVLATSLPQRSGIRGALLVAGLLTVGLLGLACTEITDTKGPVRVRTWCKEGVECSGSDFERAGVPYEHSGSAHCAWQSETFIAYRRGQFLQDEDNGLASQGGVRYEGDASLPSDARYTGWHSGQRQLWLSPSDREENGLYLNIYVVTSVAVQRWPRLDLGCA
jgi:hypothetical protein